MAIFFGDDEIQGICHEQVSRLGLEIMGTSRALKIFDENNIQFGYSDLVKESARLLREKYLHINPEITFKDILTDPRELVEAVGN